MTFLQFTQIILLALICGSSLGEPPQFRIRQDQIDWSYSRVELNEILNVPNQLIPLSTDLNSQNQVYASQISLSAIDIIYKKFKSVLPVGYPKDCCIDRALMMSLGAFKVGVQLAKVVVNGHFKYNDVKWGTTNWLTHVAPVVWGGNNKLYVIDHVLAEQPIEFSQWLSRLNGKIDSMRFINHFTYYPDAIEMRNDFSKSDIETASLYLMGCRELDVRGPR